MSSFEQYEGSDEPDGSEKSACEFVVARGDCPELFEIVEEPLDEVALAIEHEIGRPLDNPVCLGRDDGGDLPLLKVVDEGVGVVALSARKACGSISSSKGSACPRSEV